MKTLPFACASLSMLVLAFIAGAGEGGIEKSDSKVKATATASKIDADGNQAVTITLDIAKGWHLYANPVRHNNDFLNGNKTVVKMAAKEKVSFRPKYPDGITIKDKDEQYDVYKGVAKIDVQVTRSKGDTSPLEISINVSACDEKICLAPGVVKLVAK